MKQDEKYIEYRRLWNLATRRDILTDVPIHLDIELTNHCNLKCDMCWQNDFLKDQKGFIDFELYKKIVDEGVAKGVKAIKLQSRGEAMLHPRIIEAIKYARENGIIDIHLTTNATLLKERKWEEFLEAGLDIMNFSLDPNHMDSFEKIHGDDSYGKLVVENIAGFLKLKRRLNYKKPYIKIQTIKSNALGPFKSKYIDGISHMVDEIVISPYMILVDNAFDKQIQTDTLLPCSWLWQRMVINYDGKVTICCRDYNCVKIMGDIKKQTLEKIWNGKQFSEARKFHIDGLRNKIPFCAICDLF